MSFLSDKENRGLEILIKNDELKPHFRKYIKALNNLCLNIFYAKTEEELFNLSQQSMESLFEMIKLSERLGESKKDQELFSAILDNAFDEAFEKSRKNFHTKRYDN